MNFAFFIRSKTVTALRNWALKSGYAHRAAFNAGRQLSDIQAPPTAMALGITHRTLPAARPLRVVRVVERGQARSEVGRMVISGRMADVCAELDRLAAREASESGLSARSVAPAC